jgi:hypothetical protein
LYSDKGSLIGDFFFFRGTERSDIGRLIPTLAYRLSISLPDTQPFILKQLTEDPHVIRGPLRHQFNKLIVQPILAVKTPFLSSILRKKPAIMVVDALDECDDKLAMVEFVTAVIDAFSDNPRLPLRIFVTSRLEEHIKEKIETKDARSVTCHLALDKFDARVDIRRYFQFRFSQIYEAKTRVMQNVPLPWPSETELDILVKKTGGLFIFAVTLMSFMDSETVFQQSKLPQERLQDTLKVKVGLDTLYQSILSAVPRDNNFDRVVGTIMLLRSSLPINFIRQLLQLSLAHIVQSLLGIQSIILIPGGDNESIQLFHTSLRDFLVARERSAQFYINPPARHISIAMDCLKAMVKNPGGIFYVEGRQYACLNWHYHLEQGLNEEGGNSLFDSPSGLSLTSSLTDFAAHSLDVWINTMILHKGWKELPNALDVVLLRLKVCTILSEIQNSPENC